MYLRWQSRKRRTPKYGYWKGDGHDENGQYVRFRADTKGEQDAHWRAVVVESVRVDGKPRQRHVAYLGGITDSGIAAPAQRGYFWDEVRERLDRLGNRIGSEDRAKIEARIAEKVPPLSEAELEECQQRAAAWKEQIKKIAKHWPRRR